MSSPDSSPADLGEEDLVRHHVADLRKRLLDLTNRNPLLNYKFSVRSRRQIRVIDELPEFLHERLEQGQPLVFKGLPDPDVTSSEGDPPSPADVARELGLDPSYELPEPAASGDDEHRHTDQFIQVMHFRRDMDRRLSGIRATTRSAQQEMGVNTLFAAFGFLQWSETAASKPLFAPLMLHPLEIDRQVRKGDYIYGIRTMGEESSGNPSLAARLRRDFGLALPELGEAEGPGQYFDRVRDVIARMEHWRIRRFVVVGNFEFARLAMYADLDPEQWPKGARLEGHDVVRELVIGREGGGPGSSHEPREEEGRRKDSPFLIADADSSQIAAVAEALKGTNLALKGPPGTGKSQTITNLIAALLKADKKVLFVAEKMAALNVVKSRLDDAGLGLFCLELHSTRSKKQSVLEALRRRMEFAPDAGDPNELSERRREHENLRKTLNAYADSLNLPVCEIGFTSHEVLWREQQARAVVGEGAAFLARLRFEEAPSWNDARFHGDRGLVRQLEDAAVKVERRFGSTSDHPWAFMGESQLFPADVQLAVAAAATWKAKVDALLQKLVEWPTPVPLEANEAELERVCGGLLQLEAPPQSAAALVSLTSSPKGRDALRQLSEALAEQQRLLGTIDALGAAQTVDSQAELEALRSGLEDASFDGSLAELEEELQAANDAVGWLRTIGEQTTPIREFLGLADDNWTMAALRALEEASELLADVPREVLLARSAGLVDERSAVELRAFCDRIEALREQKASVSENLAIREGDEPADVAGAAQRLREGGVFAWLSGNYRRAKALHRALARSAKVPTLEMAEQLEALAEYLRARRALDADPVATQVIGAGYRGLETRVELVRGVVAWASSVRERVGGLHPGVKVIRDALLEGDLEALDAVRRVPVNRDSSSTFARFSSTAAVVDARRALEERCETLGGVARAARALELPRRLRRADIASLCDAVGELGRVKVQQQQLASGHPSLAALSADEHRGAIRDALEYADAVRKVFGQEANQRYLSERDISARLASLKEHANATLDRKGEVAEAAAAFQNLARAASLPRAATFQRTSDMLGRAVEHAAELPAWLEYETNRRALAGHSDLVELFEVHAANTGHLRGLTAAFDWVFYRTLSEKVFEKHPGLRSATGARQEQLRARFREIDRRLLVLQRSELATELARTRVSPGIGYGPRRDWTDAALIQRELEKKKRHRPIRELLGRAGKAIRQLCPCFMMSPHSVAQFLEQAPSVFDVVIVDEASQMRPEDALGAIARGRQLVVVGDPKQLPPTSFFSRMQLDEEDEDDVDEKITDESVLDMGLGAFPAAKDLRWHYRSRHESLIAFSNRQFYDNRLLVFPSPEAPGSELGVEMVRVDGGYAASTNPREAEAIVERVAAMMVEAPHRSLGVVAMNKKQQELIEGLFDQRALAVPEIEDYRSRWEGTLEPFFVKNLENVQGDERDAIVISLTYGPDPATGRVFQRFGPINGAYGHRRLNVLFTRAKRRVVLYSSMDANDVKVQPSSAEGVRALRDYLDYARSGILAPIEGEGGSPDSVFEEQVLDALRDRGYAMTSQVGVRGFYIDLAVKHPAYPHGYLCGIECDGATYHSSRSARDRDRLRQEILEGLGWRLLRVWSTDWFRDPQGEARRLAEKIERLAKSVAKIA